MHEGIVKKAEYKPLGPGILKHIGICILSGVDAYQPGDFHFCGQLAEQFVLIFLCWEIDSMLNRSTVGMIFSPMAEADLHKGQTGVFVISCRHI